MGTGIRNIYKYAPIYTGVAPLIEDEDVYIVKIGAHKKDMQKDMQKNIQKTLADRNIKLTTNQLQILIVIRENTSITRDEIIQKCELAEGQLNHA